MKSYLVLLLVVLTVLSIASAKPVTKKQQLQQNNPQKGQQKQLNDYKQQIMIDTLDNVERNTNQILRIVKQIAAKG
ncbi:hypothetical protein AC249_AIPGENE24830 [Exaiptasia diaphana]|nr:hypothetical protein AC249_AIPGENE24830 [Exaiptasia diaphana]